VTQATGSAGREEGNPTAEEEQHMADSFDRYDNEGQGGGGFMMGLLTGTVLGAGLGMLLAPKAGTELRGAIGEQARNLGSMASEQYRRASEQAGGWADKGREFVSQAKDAVARGAEEARGYAGGTTGSTYSGTGTSGNSGGSFGGTTGNTGTTGSTFGSTGATGGTDYGRS
jgi:gas vesicle protein